MAFELWSMLNRYIGYKIIKPYLKSILCQQEQQEHNGMAP
jgi:hypothetical protein